MQPYIVTDQNYPQTTYENKENMQSANEMKHLSSPRMMSDYLK